MNELALRATALTCAGCVSWLGMDFRPASAIAAASAAFLVRVPLFKPKARPWAEASTTTLGCLGAFVTAVDHQLAPGNAFWTGIAFGAVASSLLEVGKAIAVGWIKARLQAAAKILIEGERSAADAPDRKVPKS